MLASLSSRWNQPPLPPPPPSLPVMSLADYRMMLQPEQQPTLALTPPPMPQQHQHHLLPPMLPTCRDHRRAHRTAAANRDDPGPGLSESGPGI